LESIQSNLLKKFTQILVIGGISLEKDLETYAKNGGNIIIGTPGKLKVFLEALESSTKLPLKNFEILIIGTLASKKLIPLR